MSFEGLAARYCHGIVIALCTGFLSGCLGADEAPPARAPSGSALRADFYQDFVACQNAFDGASERGEPAAARAAALFACSDALVAAEGRNALELGYVDMLRVQGHVEVEDYPAARGEIDRLLARPGTPPHQIRNARLMLVSLHFAEDDICGGLAEAGVAYGIDPGSVEPFTGGFEAVKGTEVTAEEAVRLSASAPARPATRTSPCSRQPPCRRCPRPGSAL